MNGLSLLDHSLIIHDQHQSWKISYSLTDILFLTVTAVIGRQGESMKALAA